MCLSLTSLQEQPKQQEVPTAYNEAYQFHDIMTDDNPTYEEIGKTVNM